MAQERTKQCASVALRATAAAAALAVSALVATPATAALAVLAPVATPAAAAVRISAREVTVTTPGAQAVIQRAPFDLQFRTASGQTALTEVPNRRAAARPLPPTLDPEPFSLEQQPDNALSAPLTFTVGTTLRAQWHGAYWAGNLLFERRQGTVHSAREVLSVRRRGKGARFVLSTSDPSGRRLVLDLRPDGRGALRATISPSPSTGVVSIGDAFASPSGEAFHGFGGRHFGLDQRGHKLFGWVEQENFGGEKTLAATALLPSLLAQGTDYTLAQLGSPQLDPSTYTGGATHYLFPGGPNGAYYPQAQFVSSRGYGFLLNGYALSRWRMALDGAGDWQVQADGARLDYTVAPGSPARATGRLTAITGRHRLPPAWAQGPTLSRAVQNTGRESPAQYADHVRRDLADIERLRPPLSAYAFEGWATLDRSFVRQTIRRLHRLGIRAVLYLRPYVSDDPLRTQPPGDYAEALRRGLVATRAGGQPFTYDANGAPAALLDFTDPAAVRWYRQRLELMLGLGADGFMEDFGEQVQDGMRFRDGSSGAEMHNRYPVLYHRVSRRLVAAYDRRHRRHTFVFTRAGFSGRPGSAADEQANFPGDETADWSASSGLASLAPDMLNRAVGGAFGYTTDIGGYADLLTGPPDAQLFTRWSEWAALTPFFRVHNSGTAGTRTPWSYGPATYARWQRLARLHQRAVPLMRRLWRSGRRSGVPVTRPLWLAYPGDAAAARQEQEWMLGPDVLVAPVVEPGVAARAVYLPRGCWRRAGAGASIAGGRSVSAPAPLGELPYFVRCGRRPL